MVDVLRAAHRRRYVALLSSLLFATTAAGCVKKPTLSLAGAELLRARQAPPALGLAGAVGLVFLACLLLACVLHLAAEKPALALCDQVAP